MAVASYTTDLVDITLNDSGTYLELTGWTAGGVSSGETDYYIQGSACASGNVKTTQCSISTSVTSFTVVSGNVVLFWQVFFAPNSLNTFANGGQRCVIGTDVSNFKMWYSGGSDTAPNNFYGGWKNIAIDPTVTADVTTGTPGANTLVGLALSLPTTAPSKGNPFGWDATRYGRGELRINGGDIGNGYATFTGTSVQNDSQSNRWGLFRDNQGSFLWKGLMTLGYSSAVDFRDENKIVFVDSTPRVTSTFNLIQIRQSGSRVDWTNCVFAALGTVSKGNFEMVNNATVNIIGCLFKDMGFFIHLSNAVITNTTYLRCGLVTIAGTFTGCKFINSTASASALTEALASIVNSEFTSDGSNHAVELSSIGGGSMNWDGNKLTSYVAGAAGSPVTPTSTGNEAIYVNVGSGTLTINVVNGATVPSIRSAGATVNVVAGAVPILVTVQNTAGTKIQDARVLIEAGAGGAFPSDASVTITRVGTTASVAHTAHGLSNGAKVVIRGATQNAYNGIKTISNVSANAYDFTVAGSPTTPATGTITSTFVILDGLTNVNGEITISRTYSVNTPLSSRSKVRKSTSAPYYKTGSVVGTINKDTGLSVTAIMLSDE